MAVPVASVLWLALTCTSVPGYAGENFDAISSVLLGGIHADIRLVKKVLIGERSVDHPASLCHLGFLDTPSLGTRSRPAAVDFHVVFSNILTLELNGLRSDLNWKLSGGNGFRPNLYWKLPRRNLRGFRFALR